MSGTRRNDDADAQPPPVSADPFAVQRDEMVRYQIEARGLRDPRMLAALRSIPRERFIPPDQQSRSYDDQALPVGQGQTISQPYIVAFMTEALGIQAADNVLEIGTGTGYQTAILAHLAQKVFTVERLASLSETASRRLALLGISNVEFHVGDGSRGWPRPMQFNAIMVTAACREVPASLVAQLAEGGRFILPIGDEDRQMLTLVTRQGTRLIERPGIGVRFVRLIGDAGFMSPGS